MDLDPYLQALRDDLTKATALADDATRSTAERLLVALEPALRLRLVELLTDAAATVSAELDGDLIEVRMDGRDPVWWVQRHDPAPTAEPTIGPADDGDEGTARISLRLPEGLKARAEAAADADGTSLNAWLVTAVRARLTPTTPGGRGPGVRTARRVTGWA